MTTSRRYAPANTSSHLIVRGHNKMAVFGNDDECALYLQFLQHAASLSAVAVHAFAVMTTHAHLIVTPSTDQGVAKMMQRVGTRYARFFNSRHERTGAVWAGRYRAHVIDSVRYFLACLRYVERNPVEAGLAAKAEGYRWSSYSAHAFGCWPAWLVPHAVYVALGETPAARQQQYLAICEGSAAVEEVAWIQYAASHEWPAASVQPQS